jgi:hypothetical protein
VPVTCTFDAARNRVTLVISQPYTLGEWRRALDSVLSKAGPEPPTVLVDRRDAGAPTTALVDQMVTYLKAHSDRLAGARAAVIVSSDASYGMARMLDSRAQLHDVRIEMEIFRDRTEAVEWLDREPTEWLDRGPTEN